MLQKYVERLSLVFKELSEVEGGSFSQYLEAIKLEFGILGICLGYLAVFIFAIGVPILVIPKTIKSALRKIKLKLESIRSLVHDYDHFRSDFIDLLKSTTGSDEDISSLNNLIDKMNDIIIRFNGKPLDMRIFQTNLNNYKAKSDKLDLPYCLEGYYSERDKLTWIYRITGFLIGFGMSIIYLALLVPLILMII